MEERFNREEEFLRKLLYEAVTEKPSADFKSKIMRHIEADKTLVNAYEPLISERVWYLVAFAMVLTTGWLYFQFSEISIDLSGNFNYLKLEILEIRFPNIHLSRTIEFAVAFVALFFLQIPFLKRVIDKQYEAFENINIE